MTQFLTGLTAAHAKCARRFRLESRTTPFGHVSIDSHAPHALRLRFRPRCRSSLFIWIWRTNPVEVATLSIEQVVATAGDGRLLGDSECSRELREYLSQAPSTKLGEYVEHCLSTPFIKSGHVLQEKWSRFSEQVG